MLGAGALFYPSSAAHYFVMPTLPSVMRLYLLVVTTSVVGTVAPSLKMGGGRAGQLDVTYAAGYSKTCVQLVIASENHSF